MSEEQDDIRHDFIVEDPTVVRVMRKMETRAREGMGTYKTTMAANPMGLEFWLEQALEECMDLSLYLERALEELRNSDPIDDKFCDMWKHMRKNWKL